MDATYPESISPTDRSYLVEATKLLERTINTSGLPSITSRDVKIYWSKKTEHARLLYVLTITDPDTHSEVSDVFYPSDLQDRASPPLLPFRMVRLWGDLLEKNSHKHLQELLKMGQDQNA